MAFGLICGLQVQFKVLVPAGVSQPVSVTAMLLHEKLVGFDQKAGIKLPALGQQQYSRQRPGSQNLSRQVLSATGAASEGLCADADEADEPMQQDSNGEQASVGAAAEAYAVLQRKQQRAKRAREAAGAVSDAADTGNCRGVQTSAQTADTAIVGEVLGIELLARTKRLCGVSRQGTSALTHVQQQQHPSSSTMGSPTQLRQAGGHGSTGSDAEVCPAGDSMSLHQHVAPSLQCSIAARYKSMFSLGGGGVSNTAHMPPAVARAEELRASKSGGIAPAAAAAASLHGCPSASSLSKGSAGVGPAGGSNAAAAAAAMDAGELQVTPAFSDKNPRQSVGHPAGAAAEAPAAEVQQQEAGRGSQRHVSPVHRDMGQAMSSLFDMLADDEDAELEQPQQHQQQQPQVQSHSFSRPCPKQPFLPRGFPGAPGAAAAVGMPASLPIGQPAPSSSGKAEQLEQQQKGGAVRKPLVQLQHRMEGLPAGAGPAVSRPHDRASANALFGVAVQQSLRANSSSSLRPPNLRASLSSGAAALAAGAVAHSRAPSHPDSLDPEVYQRQGFHAAAPGLHTAQAQEASQQLRTPPHQVMSVFAGLDPPVNHRSSSRVSGASASTGQQGGGAAWQAEGDNQLKGSRALPDFRAFAFNAGAPSAVQPAAAFKPSANLLLFGHLSAAAGPPRSLAGQQGKLLTRPSPARSNAAAQRQQQQLASGARVPSRSAAGELARPSSSSSVPKAGLPGEVPWQQFVSVGQQADGRPDTALAGGHQQAPEQQQAVTKQAARAAWQGQAGASNVSTAAAFAAGSLARASLRGAGSWQRQVQKDVFREQEADNEPRIPEQAMPPLQPATVPPPAAVEENEGQEQPGDALDIADIFAFMR